MRHIDLNDHRRDAAVRELLTQAADPADDHALDLLFDECEHLSNLVATDLDGGIIALASYRVTDQYTVLLEYLAVAKSHRRRGLAAGLLTVLQRLHERSVVATTDADAIDFYRGIGCVISDAPEDPRWPGVQRYLCSLPYRPLLLSQPEGDAQYEAVDGQLLRGPITLVDPDPRWPQDFERLRHVLTTALGAAALAVEHTGSTSVAGLPAKPIIDVCLLVNDADDEDAYVPALRAAGLVFWHREPGWYAHRMFRPGADTSLPEANIHIFSLGSPEYIRMVLFRDYLRTHDADRAAYAAVKRQAARQLAVEQGDEGLMMDYNRIKEPFILDLHQKIFGRAADE